MRIVFVTHSIGFGGAEKMVAFVANGLASRGHHIVIANLNTQDSFIEEKKQTFSNNIEVYTFTKNVGKYMTRLYRILFLKDIVSKFGANLIISFTTTPNYVGKITSLLTSVPSVMSERGNPYITINKKNPLSRWELIMINKSKGGIFQIPEAAKFYSKTLQKRSVIIPNPIFVKEKIEDVPFSDREKSIVSVGRLDNYQKRYDIMIKAFAIFNKRYPEWKLKLYGNGSDIERIKGWCKDEGVEDNVLFMGVSKNPMKDTNNAGMFLITSDFEGISNSLLEAMAIGLPCVSTDSTPGGARMLIDNMKNGLLAPIGNPEKIAEAMSLFACNPLFAQRCGEKAKEVINRFDPDLTLDKWENYIKTFEN